jgi:hypothetical protein
MHLTESQKEQIRKAHERVEERFRDGGEQVLVESTAEVVGPISQLPWVPEDFTKPIPPIGRTADEAEKNAEVKWKAFMTWGIDYGQ